jgi:hypothetical protein
VAELSKIPCIFGVIGARLATNIGRLWRIPAEERQYGWESFPKPRAIWDASDDE